MNDEQKVEFIKNHIGVFPDFPKKGVEFKDIFTALTNGQVCIYLKELILEHIKKTCPNIDAVVGLDSRGFLFSFLIASELGIPCVPIRKKGKLPGEVESVEYNLEYGTDIFEIQKSSIKPGQRVLIIDDLLATGGSMEAAIKLVKKVDGIIEEAFVVLELGFLQGRKRLNCKVHSMIEYN